MEHFVNLHALAAAAKAETVGDALPQTVPTVSTDSRTLTPGALFVALRGPRFDGHRFVRDAVARGARAVLVDHEGAASLGDLAAPQLVVPDTLKALGTMAAAHRQLLKRPVVAVTGSNGKTTTKELIAAALATRAPVHKTEGNLNNLIGVPLTLLEWRESSWAAVIEMGMSEPGEIARLTEIATPNVGVITQVAAAHLEGLGSIAGVARAKGELFAGLGRGSVAVQNADDPHIMSVAAPLCAGRRTVRFGTKPGVDVRVRRVRPQVDGIEVDFDVRGKSLQARLPLVGRHNALNAAAAVAAALALGLDPEQAVTGLGRVALPGGRLKVHRRVGVGVGVVDDTYNANPASMRAAFVTLADLAGPARRVAVLGDMLELGEAAESHHREAGDAAGRSGVGWLLALGAHGAAVTAGARSAGVPRADAFDAVEPLVETLRQGLLPGDWVLVKGSRGMHMERVVAAIAGETR